MRFEVIRTNNFTKSFKKLGKQYNRISADFIELADRLETGEYAGKQIIENIYKVRMKNSSTQRGKSGSFRIVYYFKTNNNKIYLLDVFSKSDIGNIKNHKLYELVKKYELI
jgi:mRNA-degrading endonuclease RelE of RelBE toxin-antitoxin system